MLATIQVQTAPIMAARLWLAAFYMRPGKRDEEREGGRAGGRVGERAGERTGEQAGERES